MTMSMSTATTPTAISLSAEKLVEALTSARRQDPDGRQRRVEQALQDICARHRHNFNRYSLSNTDGQTTISQIIELRPSLEAIYLLDLLGVGSIQNVIHAFSMESPDDFQDYLTHASNLFIGQLGKERECPFPLLLAQTWSALLSTCFGTSEVTKIVQSDRKKSCLAVLDHLLLRLLRQGRYEAFAMTNECNTIDEEIARQCSTHCLDLFIRDGEITCPSSGDSFKTVVELLVPLEAQEVAKMVTKMTDAKRNNVINENNLKVVVKVLINCFEDGEKLLKAEIESRLVSSLLDWDESSFRSSLSLVRTLCSCIRYRRLAPGKSFYGEWFSSAFGSEQTSLATRANRKYQPFLQMLSRMVPEEEGHALTAHLSNRPYLPPAHTQAWKDYMVRARTKVADLTGSTVGGKLKRKRMCD